MREYETYVEGLILSCSCQAHINLGISFHFIHIQVPFSYFECSFTLSHWFNIFYCYAIKEQFECYFTNDTIIIIVGFVILSGHNEYGQRENIIENEIKCEKKYTVTSINHS